MNYKDILKEVSIELNIPLNTVNEVYKSYWSGIKKHISSLPLHGKPLTEEEFNNYRTSVCIKHIGKFVITYNDYVNHFKSHEYKRLNANKYDKDKED